MGIVITNIQRMCFHDGPGIRTTVFLKGCGIHCPWCANPENISFQIQLYPGKPLGHDNSQCGREYEAGELLHILERDKLFWGRDGGVTFSGGEPLLQFGNLQEVWKRLKERNVHIAIETSLFAPRQSLEVALGYVDFFYVDVKLLEPEMCVQVLGGDIDRYLGNMQLLAESEKQIRFRVPCSEEYVLKQQNLEEIYSFFQKYPQYPVEIFAIHNLGESKYKNLNMEQKTFKIVKEEHLIEVKREIEKIGLEVEIIKI